MNKELSITSEILFTIVALLLIVRLRSRWPIRIIILLYSFIGIQSANACTGFCICKDSTLIACKNTDWTDWRSKIWFTPSTDSTYGYVCFGFEIPHLSDGMNDKGLVVSHFSGRHKQIKKSNSKPVYRGVLSEKVLAECSTIEEVKGVLNKYNLGLFHNGMIMYSDRYGNSIIVEGDTIIEKKDFFQICTNVYQSEYKEDDNPCSRYNAVKRQILSASVFSNDMYKNTLASVCQEITQYSIIYDMKNTSFVVYLFQDYANKVEFNLAGQLKKGKQVFELASFFPKESRYNRIYVERQSPQNNFFILLFLIVSGLLFLLTIILWPSAYLLDYQEWKEKNERRPVVSIPKVWSLVISILLFVYLIVLLNFKEVFQIGLPTNMDNFPFLLRLITYIPAFTTALVLPLVLMTYTVLKKPGWTKFSKWHFSVNTIFYLILLGLCGYWGFIKL